MNFVIENLSYSTTSKPTSPSLQIISSTSTYYVDLTTKTKNELVSNQQVMWITSGTNIYRPYMTYDSIIGKIGYESSSTGAISVNKNFGNTTWIQTTNLPFYTEVKSLNSSSVSGMTNWRVSSSTFSSTTWDTLHLTRAGGYDNSISLTRPY